MDPNKFDTFTKAMATKTSRRQALKKFVATTVGGVLGLVGIGTAFARKPCKPNGIGCNTNSQCCSGGCCHGTCTDLNTNQNCGACGNVCSPNQICQNGTCVNLTTTTSSTTRTSTTTQTSTTTSSTTRTSTTTPTTSTTQTTTVTTATTVTTPAPSFPSSFRG